MTPQDHLIRQTDLYDFKTVIDIGAGAGAAARHFATRGCHVVVTGYDMESYLDDPLPSAIRVIADEDVCQMASIGDASVDAVWCAHVLEHVLDTGRALAEIHRVLRPGGWLFLSLPEYSPFVVGGHVTPGWNLGILMYVLILAGFDVRSGAFINHCWNVTAFVRKGGAALPPLRHDRGDIETLASLFPGGLGARQGMNGDLLRVNWSWAPGIVRQAERAFRRAVLRRRIHALIPPALRIAVRGRKLAKRG